MLTVQSILVIAVVWTYTYTAKLDINPHSIPPLDDVLLYVAVPMFYLNFIFSMAAAAYFDDGLYIAYLVVMVSYTVQANFIIKINPSLNFNLTVNFLMGFNNHQMSF